MQQLNDNLLCGVAIRTTGKQPGYHDLVRVYVVPLDHDMTMSKSVILFQAQLKPTRYKFYIKSPDPGNVMVCKKPLREYIVEGLELEQSRQLFKRWYDTLQLRFNKRIIPLVYDWPETQPWLKDWLGIEYDEYFSDEYRDVKALAKMINDRYWYHGQHMPFPKYPLRPLAAYANVEYPKKISNGATDIQCLIGIYRYLMQMWIPN